MKREKGWPIAFNYLLEERKKETATQCFEQKFPPPMREVKEKGIYSLIAMIHCALHNLMSS